MRNLILGALLGAVVGTGLYGWAQVDVADLTASIQANERISAEAMIRSLTMLAEAHNSLDMEHNALAGRVAVLETPQAPQEPYLCGLTAPISGRVSFGGLVGLRAAAQLCSSVCRNQPRVTMCTWPELSRWYQRSSNQEIAQSPLQAFFDGNGADDTDEVWYEGSTMVGDVGTNCTGWTSRDGARVGPVLAGLAGENATILPSRSNCAEQNPIACCVWR